MTISPFDRCADVSRAMRIVSLSLVLCLVFVATGGAQTSPSVTSLTLINADTDQPIPGFDPLSTEATLNLATLPSRNLNIRANTVPATVGSVRFAYDANSNFSTDDTSPYAFAGDINGNYLPWTPTLGRHTVTATPYSKTRARGAAGNSHNVTLQVTDSATNQPPVVNAGADKVITLPTNSVALSGSASDDGKPTPPGTLTYAWSAVSGPGSVSFSAPGALSTTATFSTAGSYTLRLAASDSVLTATDDVIVTVNPAPTSLSVTSLTLINADTDQPIAGFDPLTTGATLNLATLPSRNLNIRANTVPATVGSVRFAYDADPNAKTESTAPYALAGDVSGDYLPWTPTLGSHTLTATPYSAANGAGSAGTPHSVTFQVTDATTNQPPVVNAGADKVITLPTNSVALSGSASDDGKPTPPGTLTYAWSAVSGPGSVSFSAPGALSTTATFSTAGSYTLRLAASDSALTTTDDVIVTVNPATAGTAIRINSGGGAFTDALGRVWAADTNFSGGATFSTTQPINGTVDDSLYQSERHGNFSYQIAVPNGNYEVVLHFAEIFWTSAGKRVFDVLVEGALAVNDLDIWSQAGALAPLLITVPASVSDGVLSVQFVTVVDNALISAIEVLPGGTSNQPPVVNAGADKVITLPTNSVALSGSASDDGKPTPPGTLTYAWSAVSGPGSVSFSAPGALSTTATFSTAGSYTLRLAASDSALTTTDDVIVTVNPATAGTAIRINSGGGAFTDALGRVWAADTNFSGGATFSTTQPINGTVDDSLYQSERHGNFSYQIAVPNGNYEVVLHFAEIFWTSAGKRVFDVLVEGALAVNDLDIWSQAGAFAPLVISVPASVSDGVLSVQFVSVADNALISAIEVLEHPGHPFLHVVIEAPAWVVDYDGDGRQAVPLKGSGSHTHQLGHTLTGFVWKEGTTTLGTTADITPTFLVGPHAVTLTISDDNSPAQSLSGSTSVDVFSSTAVGGAMAAYYPSGSISVTTLIDSLPSSPGFMEVLPTLKVEAQAGKVGGSPYTGNVVVVLKGTFTATAGSYQFPMTGGVATRLFIDGAAASGAKTLAAGPHAIEARFAISTTTNLPAEVRVSLNGTASVALNKTNFTHDESVLKPFINAMPTSGPASGGQVITISGSWFASPETVKVQWGATTLTPPVSAITPNTITLTTPPGSGTIGVSILTANGPSNTVAYSYDSGQVAISFTMTPLVTVTAPTQAAWGPDGRLYVGTITGHVVIYTFNDTYGIVNVQTVTALIGLANNQILGIAFNPFDPPNPVRIYVAHSHLFAHNNGTCFTGASAYNGQVSMLEGPNFSSVVPILTGLPVSNHDHGINGMAFDAVGDLLVALGGNTNAGVPDCDMGGLPESPLSAAVVKAHLSKSGFNGAVQYDETATGITNNNQVAGATVDVEPDVDVAVSAAGLRNPYDIVWSTSGWLYGTDNGPNAGFGAASTSATTQSSDPTAPDEVLVLVEGHYYGHPNRNRGRYDPRENVYRGPSSTTFLGEYTGPMTTVPSSTNGIDEYRATTFNSGMRGNLLVQELNKTLRRVAIAPNGTSAQSVETLAGVADGLDVVAGPGGVILGIDYHDNRLTIARPNDAAAGAMKAYDIFPWRARADGNTPFVIGGVGFGTLGNTTVTIGGASATLTSVSPTRIKGFIPAKSTPTAGLLDVTVQSAGATSVVPKAVRYVLPTGGGMGLWQTGPTMPVSLGEVATGAINGVLYVVGEGSPATLAFDPVTHTWLSNLPQRPFPGNHHAAEVINGKLYLFGGLGSGSEGKVQIFDPNTDTWTLGASIPFATGSASTALINGKVYLAGGIVGTVTVNSAAVYDPATNAWSIIAAMPAGRNHTASTTDGQKLYIFGGRGPGSGDANVVAEGFNDVQVYDPTTNSWQTSADPTSGLPPLPQKRGGMGKAVYLGGEFYVIGGETSSSGTGQVTGNVYNRVDVYNPISRTWRLDAVLPTARHGIFPVLFNGNIYVAGGGTQAGFSASNVLQIFSR